MFKKTKTLRKLFSKSLFLPLFAFTLIFTSCKNDKKEEMQEIEIMDREKLSEQDRQLEESRLEESRKELNKADKNQQEKSSINTLVYTPTSFPITNVDHAPIFPGCEDYQGDAVDCLSDQVGEFVEKHFNKAIAAEEGLRGTQNIRVSFEINEEGKVQNVQSNAANVRLQKEAKRVISEMPKMKPGVLNNKAVSVQYMVPIKFEVK